MPLCVMNTMSVLGILRVRVCVRVRLCSLVPSPKWRFCEPVTKPLVIQDIQISMWRDWNVRDDQLLPVLGLSLMKAYLWIQVKHFNKRKYSIKRAQVLIIALHGSAFKGEIKTIQTAFSLCLLRGFGLTTVDLLSHKVLDSFVPPFPLPPSPSPSLSLSLSLHLHTR